MDNVKYEGSSGACRMHTKGVLKDLIKRSQQKTKALEILLENLNWDDLREDEESCLWRYFV